MTRCDDGNGSTLAHASVHYNVFNHFSPFLVRRAVHLDIQSAMAKKICSILSSFFRKPGNANGTSGSPKTVKCNG